MSDTNHIVENHVSGVCDELPLSVGNILENVTYESSGEPEPEPSPHEHEPEPEPEPIFDIEFYTTPKNSKEFNYRTHRWDLSNQLDLNTFLEATEYPFEYGGCIISRTDETDKEEVKKVGYTIVEEENIKNKEQILYLLTITDSSGSEKIIKGGKVKGSLAGRSYSAGTEYNWTITGKASSTNYIYSQIFRECLKKDYKVKFYIYQAISIKVPYPTSTGGDKYCLISPYEEMEKDLNAHLKKVLGRNLIGEGDLEALHKC